MADSDLETRYQEQFKDMPRGNDGRYGGTSGEVQSDPIPDTQYVNSGFQIESILLPIGIAAILVAVAVVAYLVTRRKARKR